MAQKVKVGIVGGAGYTGGELIRILIHHPAVEIVFINSKSNAGKLVSDVHTDLIGDTDLKFSDVPSNDIDTLFLCMGHGESFKYLNANVYDERIKIIDLSQDFRLKAHAVSGTRTFVYGLPELNRKDIQSAKNIANPGCFATAIQLAVLPLAKANLLNEEVHVSGTTGSTGAGQSLSETSHFSWRNNNFSAYKILDHQHLKEIGESLKSLQGNFNKKINFIPYRGNFSRGILVTAYTKCKLSLEEANILYAKYYDGHPFVHISQVNPHLKQVVNTNKCVIYLEQHDDTLVVISMIDNLTKGASGQAVQNMNLLFGLEETTGLKLKTTGF
jgi:N-acetyl-gamma-glutamyl-phosphate reductase